MKIRLDSLFSLTVVVAVPVVALANPQAEELGRLVAERPANEGRVGNMHFTLRNDAGKTRERSALFIHSDQEEAVKIAIQFTQPAAIRDTGFLSHDQEDAQDQNWLFLPATERVRRLPTSDRGDYFLGTDLTYGDIKDDFKFPLEDWAFTETGETQQDGKTLFTLKGEVESEEIAKETGYSRFEALIDPVTLFPVKVTYIDIDGEPLKVVAVTELEEVGHAWTAVAFSVDQLQTGHHTDVRLSDLKYMPDIDDGLLEPDALTDGVPELE